MSLTLSEAGLAGLLQLVERVSGQHFGENRHTEVCAKTVSAFLESGGPTLDEYLARLHSGRDPQLLQRLVETLTVGETYFLRDRPSLDVVEHEVLRQIIEQKRSTRRLRCWSAGCATGEEAYSLAIMLRRLPIDAREWRINILATDLNQEFLSRAGRGLYGEWSFRDADEAFRATHFTREGVLHRIRPEIAGMVRFARLNLVEDCYPSAATNTVGFDLILCRNVFLYFRPALVNQVLARLRDSLLPGGWLVLGPNDAPSGNIDGFEARSRSHAIFQRRTDTDHRRGRSDVPVASRPLSMTEGESPQTRAGAVRAFARGQTWRRLRLNSPGEERGRWRLDIPGPGLPDGQRSGERRLAGRTGNWLAPALIAGMWKARRGIAFRQSPAGEGAVRSRTISKVRCATRRAMRPAHRRPFARLCMSTRHSPPRLWGWPPSTGPPATGRLNSRHLLARKRCS